MCWELKLVKKKKVLGQKWGKKMKKTWWVITEKKTPQNLPSPFLFTCEDKNRRWKNRLCRMGNQILDLPWAEFHHLFMKSNSGGGKMRVKREKKRLEFIIRFPNLPPLSHPSIIGSAAASRTLGEEARTVPSHNEVIYILQCPESHLISLSLRGRRVDTHKTSQALSKRSGRWCSTSERMGWKITSPGNIYSWVGCHLKATQCFFSTFER